MENHKYINFGKREILELDQKKFHSLLKSTGSAARTVLAAVFGSRRPADRVLSTWFRDNRRCGSRDRRFISESIYALLRNWGLLRRFLPAERLAEIESGTIRLGRAELDALLFGALYLDAHDLPTARLLARELNLNSDIREIIRQAALLHDVGKIGISEAILNKTGKLTEEEYETIKGHVEASIGIIRHLPSLDYVIPAVIGHHERYDGKGYPRRIAGEDIPLSARILCIADSFDAMTTKRCYKDVIPKERALEILEEEAGKQFDPRLVPVFVRGMREGRILMAGEAAGGK